MQDVHCLLTSFMASYMKTLAETIAFLLTTYCDHTVGHIPVLLHDEDPSIIQLCNAAFIKLHILLIISNVCVIVSFQMIFYM